MNRSFTLLSNWCARCQQASYSHANQLIRLRNGDRGERRSNGSKKRYQSTDSDSNILSLPIRYLRAADPANFDASTSQRTDAAFDRGNGKPILKCDDRRWKIENCEKANNSYKITWQDGHVSTYTLQWVCEQLARHQNLDENSNRVLWSGLTENLLRNHPSLCIQFDQMLDQDGMRRSLNALYTHGILLVTQTPIHDNGVGVAVLASALGGGSDKSDTSTVLGQYKSPDCRPLKMSTSTDGPSRTLYGSVWSTSSVQQSLGASVADSAYGRDGLPLHTDLSYYRNPPGLQIFTMVQPAKEGGQNVFADGFYVAQRLREQDKDHFETLSQTIRRYRCIDRTTGWHLEAQGPVIAVQNGTVVSIRHNDLDRLPDVIPQQQRSHADTFFERLHDAHNAWDAILADDTTRLVVDLQAGETMVVANQRCFHGRYSFDLSEGKSRVVMGCYVSQDELDSRFRVERFHVL